MSEDTNRLVGSEAHPPPLVAVDLEDFRDRDGGVSLPTAETAYLVEETKPPQGEVMPASKTKQVIVFIDQQKFELEDRPYTPRELLTLAGENPAETTLALKHGNEIKKYENPDEPIELKNGMHFVVFHNGPTPVS